MIELVGIAGLVLTSVSVGQSMLRRYRASSHRPAAPAIDIVPNSPQTVSAPRAQNATPDEWIDDAIKAVRGNMHIRRSGVREEKIVQNFVAWMASEGYAGWYTSGQIWESFKTFAWEQRYEELSRGGLLSAVAVEVGVIKRRVYVQKNDTYRHLRPLLKNQERAVVYRMPTEAELAAEKHKRALKDADVRQRVRVPKVRLDPGRQQHPRSSQAHEIGMKNNDLGLPIDAFEVAA